MENELFVCSCSEVGHQVILSSYEGEEDAYLNVGLVEKQPFLRRLKVAFDYVLGRKTGSPYFFEVILSLKDRERMAEALSSHGY